MDYSRFLNVYANLPERVRREVVVVMDDKPYSWNVVYLEIENDTELGRAMYNKLIKMEII